MAERNRRRKGRSFGAGTYARRHDQRYQAVTGVLVLGLAIATLALHHFGFGLALLIAIGAGILCAATRIPAAVSVYVVGLALLGGIVMTPLGAPADQFASDFTPVMRELPLQPGTGQEMYVFEAPWQALPETGVLPFEAESDQWAVELPNPDAPRTYSL